MRWETLDKYEYRAKTEQMLAYAEQKSYQKAMSIADTIDWRKVKNTAMLSTVSEIYENAGELGKARDTLFIAYDKAPSSRRLYTAWELFLWSWDISMKQRIATKNLSSLLRKIQTSTFSGIRS